MEDFTILESLRLSNCLGDDSYDDSDCLLMAFTRAEWQSGSLDRLFKAVVDEEIDNLLIIGLEERCLLMPYDGGLDRGYYMNRYKSWLSKHPQGL